MRTERTHQAVAFAGTLDHSKWCWTSPFADECRSRGRCTQETHPSCLQHQGWASACTRRRHLGPREGYALRGPLAPRHPSMSVSQSHSLSQSLPPRPPHQQHRVHRWPACDLLNSSKDSRCARLAGRHTDSKWWGQSSSPSGSSMHPTYLQLA